MLGPKRFEEWVKIYEERDSDTEYVLSPGEKIVFDPMHGFFTYCFDAESREILIPKMCGDGKHWRKLIHKMVRDTQGLGVRGVLCCTKRNPQAYMRILGGKLRKMEHTYDFQTGKNTTLWFIFITLKDTKEGRENTHDSIDDPGSAAPVAGDLLCEGRGATQVDAVGPKSPQLQELENKFYAIANPLADAYTRPLNGIANGYSSGIGAGSNAAGSAGSGAYINQRVWDQGHGDQAAGKWVTQRVPVQYEGGLTGTGAGSSPANARGPVSTTSSGVPQPYDDNTLMGQLFNNAASQQYAANSRYGDLMGQMPGLTGSAQNMVNQAATAGDQWYAKAGGAYDKAAQLLAGGQASLDAARGTNEWYDNSARGFLTGSRNLLDTGEIQKPIMDAMKASMIESTNASLGASVNDLANRGVINSSVTSRGLGNAQDEANDAAMRGYLDAFNSVLGGYNDSANAAANSGKAFVDSYLNINDGYNKSLASAIGLGDSYGKTGSMRTGDLLNVANGYGGLADLNLKERDQLMKDISQYYTNAAAPMMPAYDLLQTMQTDHVNSNKKDTIVKSGK